MNKITTSKINEQLTSIKFSNEQLFEEFLEDYTNCGACVVDYLNVTVNDKEIVIDSLEADCLVKFLKEDWS